MRLLTERSNIASFFQFGQVAEEGFVSQLDGAVAISQLSTVLYFTRAFEGLLSFPTSAGGEDAVTTLYLANPSRQAVQVVLEIFNSAGQPFGLQARQIEAGGCLVETLSSLFDPGSISDGSVRVTSDGFGIVGFQTIELEDTILGLNAMSENDDLVSFLAQLAHGQSGDNRIFTLLKIVNISNSPVSVILTALREDGSVLNVAQNIVLAPLQALQRDVGELFGLGPPTSPQIDGSIRVESTGPGLLGDIIFGDPDTGHYAAALPLQSQLLSRAIFSQVANLDQGTAREQLFTGLAFHNPNTQPTRVTVRVFTEDCQKTGSTVINLGPGTRLSDLVANLVPQSAGQVRGYVVVESTLPIVAQQLFGNFALDFFLAVPPTILE